ncbi:MAG: hypothetical protein HY878_04720 [Deltaproteobacteria bacterium]|nr:hypothetical protein [Deltaproteobacteria bacterium]
MAEPIPKLRDPFPEKGIAGTHPPELTTVDYAFVALRAIVIVGGFIWLLSHPFTPLLRANLLYIFSTFVIYSLFLQFSVFTWPHRIDRIYLTALILDLGFIGVFIKLSGGFYSDIFLAFYLLVALHSFYYGLLKGLALALASAIVYLLTVFDQSAPFPWANLALRLSGLFVVAGFLGFLSEKAKQDRKELVKMNQELTLLQGRLEKTYSNLHGVKKQVEQSEKLASLGRFVAELAHEINNPLDGIKNCLMVVMKDPEDSFLRRRYLGLMEEGVQEIEGAVRDLLDYAKEHETRAEPMNVNEILRRTLLMGGYKFQRMAIKVRTDLDPRLPLVYGDPHQLQQVFVNIVFNAIDAMPDGGVLTIETRGVKGFVEVEITDNGIGIPKKDILKIFKPFYTTKKLGEGTGLGLPISLEIVKRHKGQINVYSLVGIGTTFKISLPAM